LIMAMPGPHQSEPEKLWNTSLCCALAVVSALLQSVCDPAAEATAAAKSAMNMATARIGLFKIMLSCAFRLRRSPKKASCPVPGKDQRQNDEKNLECAKTPTIRDVCMMASREMPTMGIPPLTPPLT
jgi:hypothetical protein